MKASKGEERIIELLQKGKYSFEREKRFGNLKKGHYRFDFYVHGAQPCLVEFQGEPHYKFVGKFHKSYLDLQKAQERDRRKISYCLANNIPIYCIPYWELENLHSAEDIFQEKFRARDKWKNDRDYDIFRAKLKEQRNFDRLFGNMI